MTDSPIIWKISTFRTNFVVAVVVVVVIGRKKLYNWKFFTVKLKLKDLHKNLLLFQELVGENRKSLCNFKTQA